VDRLYALNAGDFLRCRLCQRLSYRSAQEWDHFKRTGRHPGLIGRAIAAAIAGEDPVVLLRRALKNRR
jgi:hypothetical protein